MPQYHGWVELGTTRGNQGEPGSERDEEVQASGWPRSVPLCKRCLLTLG